MSKSAVAARFALRKVIGGRRAMLLRLIADHAARNPAAAALLAQGRPSLTTMRLRAETGGARSNPSRHSPWPGDRVALLCRMDRREGSVLTPTICVCAPLNPLCTTNELDTTLSHLMP
jgi:hypothetical protein